MVQEAREIGPWDTVTGLPDDVDAWISNPRFGVKEEYAAVAGAENLGLVIDLVNEEGEVLGSQFYSCGAGWTSQDNGASISHPLRKNIVGSSIYGQLLTRVTKDLAVDMSKYGESALVASAWDGLGFHWRLTEHDTLRAGEKKSALMPTEFLGERVAKAAAPAKKAAPVAAVAETDLEKKLATLASAMTLEAFQKAALKAPGVADDDALIASILDESDSGFYATHKG